MMFLWGGEEVAEDFRAVISISNEDNSVSLKFSAPVLAIDRFVSFKTNLCSERKRKSWYFKSLH